MTKKTEERGPQQGRRLLRRAEPREVLGCRFALRRRWRQERLLSNHTHRHFPPAPSSEEVL